MRGGPPEPTPLPAEPPHGSGPPPRVSVCVPHLDSEPHTAERIASLRACGLPHGEVEFLVADSGSTDGSLAAYRRWAAEDPRVRLFHTPRNGPYAAINACLVHARGAAIHVATADDTLDPDALPRLLEALDAAPTAGLATGPLRVCDAEGNPLPRPHDWASRPVVRLLAEWVDRPHLRPAPHDGLLALALGSVHTSLTQLLVRREVFARTGGFPTAYGPLGDLAWQMRAGLLFDTAYHPGALGHWRKHAGQASAKGHVTRARLDGSFDAMAAEALAWLEREDPARARSIRDAGFADFYAADRVALLWSRGVRRAGPVRAAAAAVARPAAGRLTLRGRGRWFSHRLETLRPVAAGLAVLGVSPRPLPALAGAEPHADLPRVKPLADLRPRRLGDLRPRLARLRPVGRRGRGYVVYFPRFHDPEPLTAHHHRAAWYLPRRQGVLHAVRFFVVRPGLSPGPRPPELGAVAAPTEHFQRNPSRLAFARALFGADVVLVWSRSRWRFVLPVLRALGIPVVAVDTHDPNAREWDGYASVLWRHLLPPEERERFRTRQRDNLDRLVLGVRARNPRFAAALGTGPSLELAGRLDFTGAAVVVCNSAVQDPALLDHCRPVAVAAGDAISHGGASAYAARFRADLVAALATRELFWIGTAAFGYLTTLHHPGLAPQSVLLEQRHDVPNLDLLSRPTLSRLDSTMNLHMLPLASTLADTVFVLGVDGRRPAGAGDNEDFWPHAARAQYHGLVDTGHVAHPTFAALRAASTWGRHRNSVEASLAAGEALGKRYVVLNASHIPAFAARSIPLDRRRELGLDPASPPPPAPVPLSETIAAASASCPRRSAMPKPLRPRTRPRASASREDRAYWESLRGRYAGRPGWVIGNGPSLRMEDLDRLAGEVTIASNRIHLAFEKTRWRPTFHTVADRLVIDRTEEEFPGVVRLVHVPAGSACRYPGCVVRAWTDLGEVGPTPGEGTGPVTFSDDVSRGAWAGATITYFNLQLAAHLGLSPIHVLGCDHAYAGEEGAERDEPIAAPAVSNHFDPAYREPGQQVNPAPIALMDRAFAHARAWSDASGVPIRNATRGGRLEAFERVDADAVLPAPESAAAAPPVPPPPVVAVHALAPAPPAAEASPPPVTVFLRCPPTGYSGGRYYAWWTIVALVRLGHPVTVVTNARPGFFEEFPEAERDAVRVHLAADLVPPADAPAPGLVLVVPGGRLDGELDKAAVTLARDAGARLALLNFETPNWFNALCPFPRDPKRWDGWRYLAHHADLVLNMDAEAARFARCFYADVPEGTRFCITGPPINDRRADEALAEAQADDPGGLPPRAVCIVRFNPGDPHKGGGEVAKLFGPELRGVELCLIVGRDGVPEGVAPALDAAAAEHGMSWCAVEAVSDAEKFRLLHHGGGRSVLIFPTRFEGYGYPPMEALYLGVPAVAYRLPVLEEIGGGLIDLVEPGDADALRAAAAEALAAGRMNDRTLTNEQAAALTDLRERVTLAGFTARLGEAVRGTLAAATAPAASDAEPERWPARGAASASAGPRPQTATPSLYIRARRIGGRLKRALGMKTSLSEPR